MSGYSGETQRVSVLNAAGGSWGPAAEAMAKREGIANPTFSKDFDIPSDLGWNIGVVVGHSGSGKTSVGSKLWGGGHLWKPGDWPANDPIIDAIVPGGTFDEATGALATVGLGNVPSWLRPFRVLSNGEQFRAELARVIAEAPDKVVIDEFSALPLDEPVLTPDGWRLMGDLGVGDMVVGSDGFSTKIVAVPFRGPAPLYEVETADSEVIRCSSDHLWTVRRRRRGWRTLRTEDLAREGLGIGSDRWYLPATPVVRYDVEATPDDLPIHPYLLGVLLGDGSLGPTTPHFVVNDQDQEIVSRIRTDDKLRQLKRQPDHPSLQYWRLVGGRTTKALCEMGLRSRVARTKDGAERDRYARCHEKFIPGTYLRSSPAARVALLRGLMDTDGCATGRQARLSTVSRQLALDVVELVRSLGGTAYLREDSGVHRTGAARVAYQVSVRTPECPFGIGRKANRWKPPVVLMDREIVSVRPIGEWVDQQCITVDNPDGLFITRGMVVTHNSVVDRQIACIGALAFSKAWRRTGGQAVLLTPHRDVLEWLDPDWVLDTDTGALSGTRGLWKRPSIDLEIRQTGWSYWEHFKPHHYLQGSGPMAYATAFVGFVDGNPVCHLGMTGHHVGKGVREARACRLVVMPEWQGAGVSMRFLNYLCERELRGEGYIKKPTTTLFHTAHPALCKSLRRDEKWRQISGQLHGLSGERSNRLLGGTAKFGGHWRVVQGFRYYGQRGVEAAAAKKQALAVKAKQEQDAMAN